MKNFKLLLATTAILSAGLVINSNAESVKAEFRIGVGIFNPISITTTHADFDLGAISNNGGKVLKVKPDGSVDETVTTAQVVGKSQGNNKIVIKGARYTSTFADNFYEGNNLSNYRDILNNTNSTAEEISNAKSKIDEFGLNYGFIIVPDDDVVVMMSDKTNSRCGELSNHEFMQIYRPYNDNAVEVYYGGTFTLDDDYDAGDTLDTSYDYCEGTVHITVLEDY